MIEYLKSGIDIEVLRLLKKLGPDYPLKSLCLDIENKYLSISKVYYDGKLYGILVVRGVRTRKGEWELVCNHVIAEDEIEISFNSILAESLPKYAASCGFEKLRIHSKPGGIERILTKWAGSPKELVFIKDLAEWKTQEIAKALHHNQPQQAQQIPTQE